MADDQGWGDVSSRGNEAIATPVLDRLAADGARFDRFYVSPVCAPTRASLLTGRYSRRTGVFGVTRGEERMRSEEVTLAEVFQAAGYATGAFGKWHNGAQYPHHPNGQGFDEFVGFCAGHWNNYFDTTLERSGEPFPTQGYITDVLTDHALQFLEANRDRPFFIYVPYNAPHSPWQLPDGDFERHKARGLDHTTASAFGMVESLDSNVGRLLERLDALGSRLQLLARAREGTEPLSRTDWVRVAPAFQPERIPSPDRVPRKEVYERTWGSLDLGHIQLSRGRLRLELRATPVSGAAGLEVKGLCLERLD